MNRGQAFDSSILALKVFIPDCGQTFEASRIGIENRRIEGLTPTRRLVLSDLAETPSEILMKEVRVYERTERKGPPVKRGRKAPDPS